MSNDSKSAIGELVDMVLFSSLSSWLSSVSTVDLLCGSTRVMSNRRWLNRFEIGGGAGTTLLAFGAWSRATALQTPQYVLSVWPWPLVHHYLRIVACSCFTVSDVTTTSAVPSAAERAEVYLRLFKPQIYGSRSVMTIEGAYRRNPDCRFWACGPTIF